MRPYSTQQYLERHLEKERHERNLARFDKVLRYALWLALLFLIYAGAVAVKATPSLFQKAHAGDDVYFCLYMDEYNMSDEDRVSAEEHCFDLLAHETSLI